LCSFVGEQYTWQQLAEKRNIGLPGVGGEAFLVTVLASSYAAGVHEMSSKTVMT